MILKIKIMIEEENPWKTLQSEIRYENNWIKVTHHQVINPSGKEGIYGTVHFKHIAIGVLVLDEDWNTWLVGQYRFPGHYYSWEIPEGGGKQDVPWIDSAKRELQEETGIVAEHWEEIVQMHLSNSATDEFGVIYLARGLSFGEAEPEETEDLKVMKLPFDAFFEMVEKHQITDSLTVAAAYKVKWMMDSGKISGLAEN